MNVRGGGQSHGVWMPLTISAKLDEFNDTWVHLPPDRDMLLAFVPEGAICHPQLEAIAIASALARPDVDIFYGDEAAFRDGQWRLYLKPTFNPALLLAQDYIGSALLVRASALHRLGGLRPAMATASLYDLVLRADADGMVIDAVREVILAHVGARPESSAPDRLRALQEHLARAHPMLTARPGLTPTSTLIRRTFDPYPAVTLVVPTCRALRSDGRPHLEVLIESLSKTNWPMAKLTLLIGDDVGAPALRALSAPFEVVWLHTPRPPTEPFNYSAKMNVLWRKAETEYLVLLNDDVEVVDGDWLCALLTHAASQDVGGVGARLLYANGAIQHAGMVGGILGGFVHAWIGQDAMAPTYCDWALVQRDWSAVTGAVFATRRLALEAVDGFDEQFALEYNDVDLCLRLQMIGLRVVYAPDAELVHHEKASRAASVQPGSQTAAFLRRWGDVIADDPAYHPHLSKDGFTVRPAPGARAWYETSTPSTGR